MTILKNANDLTNMVTFFVDSYAFGWLQRQLELDCWKIKMENNRLVAVRYLWFQRWMSWSVGFGRSPGLWRIVIVCREFCTSLPCIFSLPWLLLSIICFESTIFLHLLVYQVFISHRQQRLQLYSVHQSTSLHDKWYDLTLVRSSQNLTEIHFSSCGKY